MMRRSRYRQVLVSLFAAAVAMGVLLGSTWSAASQPPDGTSYALTDFEVSHPYDDPRQDVGPDASVALVSYVVAWESADYPGEVPCHIELMDSSGTVVGQLEFTQSSGVSGVRGPGLQVPVTGSPETARGWCGPSGDTDGRGYDFSSPREIESQPAVDGPARGKHSDTVAVTFDVTRVGSVSPGIRSCALELRYEDGSRQMSPPTNFSMADTEGTITFEARSNRPADVRDAQVTCRPFRGRP